MEIVLARLMNGELVIGKDEGADEMLHDAKFVHLIPTPEGPVLALTDWTYPLNIKTKPFTVRKSLVMFSMPAPEPLKNVYVEATTGITIANVQPANKDMS